MNDNPFSAFKNPIDQSLMIELCSEESEETYMQTPLLLQWERL